ncbi:hypothetical protein CDAR_234561 [Caerostris darwini]|uniref:Uncharacterized protein n=1 Tax=Caerostris darwini TaxID=1538125 RepID=A0AAV4TJE1_9ARAC|nr:hypothetical protein CDAR_234561 [Caerostris darwini]
MCRPLMLLGRGHSTHQTSPYGRHMARSFGTARKPPFLIPGNPIQHMGLYRETNVTFSSMSETKNGRFYSYLRWMI